MQHGTAGVATVISNLSVKTEILSLFWEGNFLTRHFTYVPHFSCEDEII